MALTSFWACQKPNNTGEAVQPKEDIIGAFVTDTFNFETGSIARDTLRTDEWNYGVLGKYYDGNATANFGTTTANLYTQLWTTGNNPIFALDNSTNYTTLDSVVLFLQYANYYGDTATSALALTIKEISDTIHKDGVYFSKSTGKPTKGNNIINNTTNATLIDIRPTRVDSIKNRKDPTKKVAIRSQLHIRLDNTFGTKLLTENVTDPAQFANATVFTQSYFKGLAFETNQTNTSPGVVAAFDLNSAFSRIVLYYKVKKQFDNSIVDSLASYDFPLNNASIARYNTFKRDVAPNTLSTQYSYLQTGVMYDMYFKIKDIEKLKNIAINKAELTLSVDDETVFRPSRYLAAYHANTKREDSLLISGASFVSYDTTAKAYKLNLTNYVQAIVMGKLKNQGLVIRSLGYFGLPATDIARTIIHGVNSPYTTKRPKLRVIYTPIQ